MSHLPTTLILLLTALPLTHAWGTLGHTTIAFIAQNKISAHTTTWTQSLLSNTSTIYLADTATWADSYRYTGAGAFSAPFHFIDAEDNPPLSCGVEYERDCGRGGCVVR